MDDNIWNIQRNLSPKYLKYSGDSSTFKKSVLNIKQVEQEEKEQRDTEEKNSVIHHKSQSQERHTLRKLERSIVSSWVTVRFSTSLGRDRKRWTRSK